MRLHSGSDCCSYMQTNELMNRIHYLLLKELSTCNLSLDVAMVRLHKGVQNNRIQC